MQATGYTETIATPAIRSEALGVAAGLILGLFIIFTIGFAGASVLHEAAHDSRHSIAFPCH